MAAAPRYPSLTAFLNHRDASFHDDLPYDDIRGELLSWYEINRRRLPWRGDAPPYNGSTAAGAAAPATLPPPQPTAAVSSYGVWVSEIMLQQTRVEAVIPYWLAWMEAFPTVEDLAAASEEEVNAKWAGLGFYRRARMLHEGSQQVVRDFGGSLPTTVEELLQIKGIGPYTAGAVASISAGVAAPIVDGNVLRVFSRLSAIAAHPKEPAFANDGKLAWKLARSLVEAGGGSKPGALNQALMELGATLCAPSGSGIDASDPLAPYYRSTQIGRDAFQAHKAGELTRMLDAAVDAKGGLHACPVCAHGASAALDALRCIADGGAKDEAGAASLVHGVLPLPVPKKGKREERLAIAALYRVDGGSGGRSWLLVKRPAGGLLAGQWEFPHEIVATGKESLPDDPGVAARAAATERALSAAGVGEGSLGDREALSDSLEHIFSHVRHTMHVEHAASPPPTAGEVKEEGEGAAEPWTSNGRTYCWMGEQRMREVGITAGVLKVIAAVESATGRTSANKSAGKRKSTASVDTTQPKMSKFFSRKERDA